MPITMIIVFAVLSVIAIVIISFISWWIGTRNNFKRFGLRIEESFSDIDVALTKRYDVLTKMMEITKGYAKHEKETLSMTIAMRKGMTMEDMKSASKQMDEAAAKINILAEAYPDLKANTNFLSLQSAVLDVEEHLQAARRVYNSNVRRYNELRQVFPSSIVANSMKLVDKEFFEADEIKRKDVEMKF